jgi:peroxiredoxin
MARIQRTLLLGLALLLLAACGPAQGPVEGGMAPDFEAESLSGETVKLSDFRGHPVLINFWATWCIPCEIEMPAIQARYETYSPELVVLAVDFDEPRELVEDFVYELDLTFNVLLDPGGSVQQLYRVRGYPTSVFVDAEGVIQKIHIGLMTEKQLDENLAWIGLGPDAQK